MNGNDEVNEALSYILKTGHCSLLLKNQLINVCENTGLILGKRLYYFESWRIFHKLEFLESGKPPLSNGKLDLSKEYQGDHFKGLFHIHFESMENLGFNLLKNFDKNATQIFNKAKAESDRNKIDDISIVLPHFLVIESERDMRDDNKITGECIIYAEHNAKNYYLTLRAHNEDDLDVLRRLQPAINEYPELKHTIIDSNIF